MGASAAQCPTGQSAGKQWDKYASVAGLWHGSLEETLRDDAGAEEVI